MAYLQLISRVVKSFTRPCKLFIFLYINCYPGMVQWKCLKGEVISKDEQNGVTGLWKVISEFEFLVRSLKITKGITEFLHWGATCRDSWEYPCSSPPPEYLWCVVNRAKFILYRRWQNTRDEKHSVLLNQISVGLHIFYKNTHNFQWILGRSTKYWGPSKSILKVYCLQANGVKWSRKFVRHPREMKVLVMNKCIR